MKTLLLAFANSETNKLPSLMDEYFTLNKVLVDRAARGEFRVVSSPVATREQVSAEIQAYENSICLFLFSGHAGNDSIYLEDGQGQAGGVAAMLGRCPNLKIVVLNGCSTAGQVNELLASGVPVVIATSASVGDSKATIFSKAFFRSLSMQNDSIIDAFDKAMSEVQLYNKVDYNRGLDTVASGEPLWGIYYNESNGIIVRSWKLDTDEASVIDQIRHLVTDNKIQEAINILLSFNETMQDASIVMNKFKKLKRDDMLGFISNSEANLQRAQIAYAVLELGGELR